MRTWKIYSQKSIQKEVASLLKQPPLFNFFNVLKSSKTFQQNKHGNTEPTSKR